MARDVLAMLVSIVVFESAFSTRGRVLDSFSSTLAPRIVETLIYAQDWLRSCPHHIYLEQSLEQLESLELGKTSYILCRKFIISNDCI